MNALQPPHLEQLLAITLAELDRTRAALTAAHLRVLEVETARHVAEDERDAAQARARRGAIDCSAGLRHEATQASVELRSVAHTLKKCGRALMAAGCESRADKIVKALKGAT